MIIPNIQLSDKFWLQEFVKSPMASRNGIVNWPPTNEKEEVVIERLRFLCVNVMQPVRDHYKRVISPSSGYRCPELNTLVGSRSTSDHLLGYAADWEIIGVSNLEVARFIEYNIEFDQLILEYYTKGEPNSGWIHTSFRDGNNRGQILTIDGKTKTYGLPE